MIKITSGHFYNYSGNICIEALAGVTVTIELTEDEVQRFQSLAMQVYSERQAAVTAAVSGPTAMLQLESPINYDEVF